MERISSIDDILGTYWKLDPQGEGQNTGAAAGVPPLLHGASEALKLGLSYGDDKVGAVMNRSASEWAFQEFLKEHMAAAAASVTAAPQLGYGRKPVIYEESEDDEKEAESDEVSGASAAAAAAPHVIAAPDQEVMRPSSSRRIMADDVEVTGALNPLFSGLRDEVNCGDQTSNPQEYEHFLKYKLDLACAAVALTRVCHLTFSFCFRFKLQKFGHQPAREKWKNNAQGCCLGEGFFCVYYCYFSSTCFHCLTVANGFGVGWLMCVSSQLQEVV